MNSRARARFIPTQIASSSCLCDLLLARNVRDAEKRNSGDFRERCLLLQKPNGQLSGHVNEKPTISAAREEGAATTAQWSEGHLSRNFKPGRWASHGLALPLTQLRATVQTLERNAEACRKTTRRSHRGSRKQASKVDDVQPVRQIGGLKLHLNGLYLLSIKLRSRPEVK